MTSSDPSDTVTTLCPDRIAEFEARQAAAVACAIASGKPAVIAHGDSHYFRVDKPLCAATLTDCTQTLENVTRVENFGAQYVHWVEVIVNAQDPEVFRFEQRIVDALRFPRLAAA